MQTNKISKNNLIGYCEIDLLESLTRVSQLLHKLILMFNFLQLFHQGQLYIYFAAIMTHLCILLYIYIHFLCAFCNFKINGIAFGNLCIGVPLAVWKQCAVKVNFDLIILKIAHVLHVYDLVLLFIECIEIWERIFGLELSS